ncbi:MAG TPA: hypothetical protein VKT32_05245 [Chthonomonadaceae bacterium]|nr:hypothetical protein [Chthonomonadaceae bacterium]
MNRSSFYNIATIAVPLTCFLLAIGLVFYEIHRLSTLKAESHQTAQQIAQVEKIIHDIEAQPPSEKIPAVPQTANEQVDFLNVLRLFASESRVTISRWSNATPLAPVTTSNAPGNNGSGNNAGSSLPSGITPIASSVEVTGPYSGVRRFFYDLLQEKRLINMTEFRWSRGQYPQTHVSFTLTRYVSPPPATATSASGTATPTNPTG